MDCGIKLDYSARVCVIIWNEKSMSAFFDENGIDYSVSRV